MNRTVKVDRLIFRSAHRAQVSTLLCEHLSALRANLQITLKERKDQPGVYCLPDFKPRVAEMPSNSGMDLEDALNNFFDAVGPFLSNAARSDINRRDDEVTSRFTDPNLTGTDVSIHASKGANLEDATPFPNEFYPPEGGRFKPGLVFDELKISHLSRLVLQSVGVRGTVLTPESALLIDRINSIAKDLEYQEQPTASGLASKQPGQQF